MSSKDTVIERGPPGAVTYDMSSVNQVTITLPQNSTWTSSLHWHETHTEFLRVVRGSIRVRLGSTVQTIAATAESQPEIQVDPFVWHEWSRAEPGGGEVVVVERTNPADGEKALFFWNLNGVILSAPRLLQAPGSASPPRLRGLAVEFWITLNLYVIFYHLDNIPVFLNSLDLIHHTGFHSAILQRYCTAIDRALSHLILYSASLLGRVLGISAVRPDYTPGTAYADWMAKKQYNRRKAL